MTGEARARETRWVVFFRLSSPTTKQTFETAGGSGADGSGGGGGGGGGEGAEEVGDTPASPEERHFRHAVALLTRQGVTNLERVEYLVNPTVEAAYADKKGEMRARIGSGGVNERLLFHGTSFANSESIAHENFCLDMVGRVLTCEPHCPGCQVGSTTEVMAIDWCLHVHEVASLSVQVYRYTWAKAEG